MLRRVLLSAALAAAAFAQQPAHATVVCFVKVTLTGTVNTTVPVCFDYDDLPVSCLGTETGPPPAHVVAQACYPKVSWP